MLFLDESLLFKGHNCPIKGQEPAMGRTVHNSLHRDIYIY